MMRTLYTSLYDYRTVSKVTMCKCRSVNKKKPFPHDESDDGKFPTGSNFLVVIMNSYTV